VPPLCTRLLRTLTLLRKRPKTPELGSEWRSSRGRSAVPVRALAAYSDVGVEAEGNFAASIVGTCQDMCPGESLTGLCSTQGSNGFVTCVLI
jgi:hypothetical protein